MSTGSVTISLAEFAESVQQAAEETFILFSQDLPQNDLGILDDKVSQIDIDINGHDYSIMQSSSLLKSTRAAGTTGAMMWKVTPRVARWLTKKDCILWKQGLLNADCNILELGCGVAGLLGMTLAPMVSSYVLTDQMYVLKLLKENIDRNQKQTSKSFVKANAKTVTTRALFNNLFTLSLDWEKDSVLNLRDVLVSHSSFDIVLICDCIYNNYLIEPLVQTCADICKIDTAKPTYIIIAQQLRTDDVFEEWLARFMEEFDVWRFQDDFLPADLRSGSGYVVHIALLRGIEQPS